MKFEVGIEKEKGCFTVTVTYKTTDGKKHAATVLHKTNVYAAIIEAMGPLTVATPDFDQEQLDAHYQCK